MPFAAGDHGLGTHREPQLKSARSRNAEAKTAIKARAVQKNQKKTRVVIASSANRADTNRGSVFNQ